MRIRSGKYQPQSPSLGLTLFTITSALALPGAGFSSEGQEQVSGVSRPADPDRSSRSSAEDPLHGLDAALKTLTAKVSPAVVQVLVSGYGATNDEDDGDTAVVTRQHSMGSGVIVDPSGYIMTNAHVVRGEDRVEVLLTRSKADADTDLPSSAGQSLLPAVVVGMSDDFDLALLKIEATGLPVLAFADARKVRQGQLVLAVGSPMGLENSVTLGVLSSTARQPDPDSPLVFVQTDAPINPGNSGGALVDADGDLVGINTFILTQAGGSEGLGFAIPAPIVKFVYESLRSKGHVERRTVGIGIQTLTPTLAKALGLDRPYGIIVADVTPDGPADRAGVKIGDIILEANGHTVTSPPQLDAEIYLQEHQASFGIEVLRRGERIQIELAPEEEKAAKTSILDRIDPDRDSVPRLGVLAATVTPELETEIGELRIHSGVVVIAREKETGSTENELSRGDVIHSVNGSDIPDVDTLRRVLSGLQQGDAVVLQVERGGGFRFVSFLMN